jgi:hypothetical protein
MVSEVNTMDNDSMTNIANALSTEEFWLQGTKEKHTERIYDISNVRGNFKGA